MPPFAIIPVLDLMRGEVVRARAGERATYRPIETKLAPGSRPEDVLRGLRGLARFPAFYVADLDAIAGTGNHFELVRGLADALPTATLWIDAGFSDVAECAFWLPLGATLVIGSESLSAVDAWQDIHGAFGESVVLSLDFDANGRKGPAPLFDDPGLWPLRVVAMSLARVGAESGPDLDRLKSIVETAGGRAVYAAGGVRDASDLARIASVKAQGAILATALHSQAITQKEIAALLRERRP